MKKVFLLIEIDDNEDSPLQEVDMMLMRKKIQRAIGDDYDMKIIKVTEHKETK